MNVNVLLARLASRSACVLIYPTDAYPLLPAACIPKSSYRYECIHFAACIKTQYTQSTNKSKAKYCPLARQFKFTLATISVFMSLPFIVVLRSLTPRIRSAI